MYPCINGKNQKEYNTRKHETGKQAEEKDPAPVRRYRRHAAGGLVNYTGIVVGHCLSQGIFLSSVEKEHVEALLDLLLSFY